MSNLPRELEQYLEGYEPEFLEHAGMFFDLGILVLQLDDPLRRIYHLTFTQTLYGVMLAQRKGMQDCKPGVEQSGSGVLFMVKATEEGREAVPSFYSFIAHPNFDIEHYRSFVATVFEYTAAAHSYVLSLRRDKGQYLTRMQKLVAAYNLARGFSPALSEHYFEQAVASEQARNN
ncbi:hypothetical protein JW930_02035 [Candidatus Woesearchaeota archaeon]|nr:hypothetical protein [Candidatus Woesearchaeota archaeon]